MKILLFSRYSRMGASSRIRSLQYLGFLEQHGIMVDVAPLLGNTYLMNLYNGGGKSLFYVTQQYMKRMVQIIKCRKYDLLWIEKELFPHLPAWMEQLLVKVGKNYIVDYDDALFHEYDMAGHNRYELLDMRSRIIKKFMGEKIDRVMRDAKLVIAGNDYLASRATSAGANRVSILPSVIDLDQYPKRDFSRNGKLSIGWIGTPVTVKFLDQIRTALQQVCRDHNARLVIIGAAAGSFNMQCCTINHPWSEETETDLIHQIDVGIMPLPNTPWARGKCGYKLIQYMACAKPVVASAVGANKTIVSHGKDGFLANTQDQWKKSLTQLATDKALRIAMGIRGRNKIESGYCLQVTAPKLINLLRSIE